MFTLVISAVISFCLSALVLFTFLRVRHYRQMVAADAAEPAPEPASKSVVEKAVPPHPQDGLLSAMQQVVWASDVGRAIPHQTVFYEDGLSRVVVLPPLAPPNNLAGGDITIYDNGSPQQLEQRLEENCATGRPYKARQHGPPTKAEAHDMTRDELLARIRDFSEHRSRVEVAAAKVEAGLAAQGGQKVVDDNRKTTFDASLPGSWRKIFETDGLHSFSNTSDGKV